ncbi:MAG TPA: DNA polymerase I [Burkholderiaceae bacterium]|nr:DNA polymerase I [Burkholderiaceae bacterium]HMZ01394.1 DNA polymerase I [Burkholderiaceae bacterium]HNB42705.1 DNA polymerase I [Burkholderiaceae bacterium]HNG81829.1 DNA polymerase I [Burkholderiaceae bacterium]
MQQNLPEAGSTARPILLLVDGSSYLYRAYHAMPDLRGPAGEPTGAIHGIVAMLQQLRQQIGAEHAACVFDASGPTFRDAIYPDYKGHRPPMPEDLRAQIAPIHAVVRLLGWPVLEVPGIEADDAIGTLARLGEASGHRVVISTGDKDLAQLVTDHVTLINTMSRESLDREGVLAKFGVPPERIVDYLALMGDAVDNVPGVEKVGPKTAAKWIAEHGSLDGVIAAAERIKGVAGENLRKALDWLPTGRQLVTVKTDCDLGAHLSGWPSLDALAFDAGDAQALLAFYAEHGFKTWRRDLEARLGGAPRPAAPVAVQADLLSDATAAPEAADGAPDGVRAAAATGRYETVVSIDQLDAWIERLASAELAALDTETDSLDAMRARIVGISLAVQPYEAAYIPIGHDYPGAPEQLPIDRVLERLRPWLENPAAAKLGQNIKYDLHVFANHGIAVQGYRQDTMLESYVLEAHKPHGLASLAERHLGRKGLNYEDLCGKGASQIPFSHVDVERATTYSGEDSEMALQVHAHFGPEFAQEVRLRELYERIELPTAQVLMRIERNGVLVDAGVLARQSQQLAQRMLELEREAYEIAGQPFNMGSPKQIGEILFGKLGLPVKKKTATGAPSTDEEVLQDLAADYPLPARILEHRSLAKLKGTYTDKLPQMVNPATGRIHTNYAQAVAITGRLSSNEPNLQNIPIRTAEGRRVREAFIAPPGHQIVSADYSQIELRLMAHISGDTNLLAAFAEGQDVHRATAAEVFGVALNEVSSEQRRYAKTINFGLIYGMGAFGLASSLGIEQKAARDYIDRYFARYPGVKRYMEETKLRAAQTGYVETLFGRRIVLPEIRGGNGPRRSAAERQAINAPMQGTAADLIKLAMIEVQRCLDAQGRASRMIMQVHDELVLEVPDVELAWAKEALPRLMSGVAQLEVPLVAEVGVGANWEEAH